MVVIEARERRTMLSIVVCQSTHMWIFSSPGWSSKAQVLTLSRQDSNYIIQINLGMISYYIIRNHSKIWIVASHAMFERFVKCLMHFFFSWVIFNVSPFCSFFYFLAYLSFGSGLWYHGHCWPFIPSLKQLCLFL